MNIGIFHKIFSAILFAAGMAVVSMVLIMHWSMKQGFTRYLNRLEKDGVSRLSFFLEDGYHHESSWKFVINDPELWRQLIVISMSEAKPPFPHASDKSGRPDESFPKRLPPDLIDHFTQRFFLLDVDRNVLISQNEILPNMAVTPLFNEGRTIGFLGLLPYQDKPGPHQERFLKEQTMVFIVVAWIVLFLAVGLSLLLSGRLVRPIRSLVEATRRLAAGEFTIRVPVGSGDELGQLAAHFNVLAMTLEKNELSRRQWVADISHELRTPVAILRGEIEAIEDGVRCLEPESLRSFHGEVLRLARLVDDLYQLAMSDLGALTYRKEKMDIVLLLKEMITIQLPKFAAKKIALTTSFPAKDKIVIIGDTERLRQLFTNIFDNSLKYTYPKGELHLQMGCHDENVIIDFQDSSPHVVKEDMERLFERLFRVESSRNRSTGGAGLGLAICRNIVEAHQGTIKAQSSPLGGLWIQITLPLQEY